MYDEFRRKSIRSISPRSRHLLLVRAGNCRSLKTHIDPHHETHSRTQTVDVAEDELDKVSVVWNRAIRNCDASPRSRSKLSEGRLSGWCRLFLTAEIVVVADTAVNVRRLGDVSWAVTRLTAVGLVDGRSGLRAASTGVPEVGTQRRCRVRRTAPVVIVPRHRTHPLLLFLAPTHTHRFIVILCHMGRFVYDFCNGLRVVYWIVWKNMNVSQFWMVNQDAYILYYNLPGIILLLIILIL